MTVSAQTVSMSPSEFYETNSVDFGFNVSNNDGNYEIKEISLDLNPLTILGQVDYKGWTESYNSSLAMWTDGSIATNDWLSVFELLARAPLVTEDTDTTTTLTLIDDQDNEHTLQFPITIKNDDTAPELSNPLPEDLGFIKEGVTDQEVHVTAVDPETGIETVSFHYVRCNYEENITPSEYTHQLVPDEDIYQNNVDFSNYLDSQQVCFDFLAYNKGGDSSSYEGTFTVDGIPPEVFLIAPLDGDLVGMDTQFSFYASDNLATTLNCELMIDDEVSLDNISAENMDTVQIPSAEVDEGQHNWSITCFDQVGWQGDSETREYTLDKTPPEINLTSPENNSIVADSEVLQFDVSDNYQLAQVWYVVDGNTTYVDDEEEFNLSIAEWPSGPNEITVVAEDLVGNRKEVSFVVTIDRSAPKITMLSPEENSTQDVHVNFSFVADDDYDDELECTVFVDNNGEGISAISGEESVQERLIAIGDYSWSVVCVDDAGNKATTDDRSFTVLDLTGPDISMNNPNVVIRSNPIDINFEVSDISGVDAVVAVLRGPDDSVQTISLESVGESYSASLPTTMNSTLGNYTLEVLAVDTLNNSRTAEDQILLTYRYAIELDASPNPSTPSQGVMVSGVVVKDDGSDVPEDEALLFLPTENVSVSLVNGLFNQSFTAPDSAGSYNITLQVRSLDNDQIYTKVETLTVENPAPISSPVTGGGSGGHGTRSHPVEFDTSGCTTDWSCTAWTTCEDGEQERTCVDLNSCSVDSSRAESRKCKVKEKEEKKDDKDTSRQSVIVAPVKPAETIVVQQDAKNPENPEDAESSAVVGKAFGFLGLGPAALINVLFVLLLLAVLLGTLRKVAFGGKKKTSVSSDDKLGIGDYLERRHR